MPGTKVTKDKHAEMVRLHVEDGFTLTQIGDAYGVSRQRVSQIFEMLGVATLTHQRWREQREIRNVFWAVYVAAFHELRVPVHGTLKMYHKGCSCDECRAANSAYARRLKGRPPPNHGVSGYMNYGCRCDICKEAHADHLWLREPERWR